MKVNADAIPYLQEYARYFTIKTKQRENLTKNANKSLYLCQIVIADEPSLTGRALKEPEPYARKLALTVLRGRKLPGWLI